MIIELIDHALNVVLTGILYGSEASIVAAFGLYVATHKRPAASSAAATIDANVVETQVTTKKVTEVVTTTPEIELPTPVLGDLAASEIVCEPVDWKMWKASDLRKTTIAKTCGVRTRPVGSSRNLSKADLIAQYEQQLKRFTQHPVTTSAKQKAIKREKIMA